MVVRFTQSIATDRGSYLVGRLIELPDPLPEPFLTWLRGGIVEPVKGGMSETAIPPEAVEQAISRRTPPKRKGRRKVVATVPATDGEP